MIDVSRNLADNLIDLFSIGLYIWNNPFTIPIAQLLH